MSNFQPAVKHAAKLRLAIAGPSGSGKTYTALSVATGLGQRIAVVDTEHGSASKYADLFSFDVLNLSAPFHPDRFVEAIKDAGAAGYDVVIVDSVSHEWNGAGGMLELVEQFSRKYKGNSYAAWGDATPLHNKLVESIVGAPLHVIATMRSKQDYILVERNGKQTPQKVGMAPVQRDGFEYEFDVYLDMDIENNGIVSKTRCPALTGRVLPKPGADLSGILREWLAGKPAPAAISAPATWEDIAPAAPTNGNGKRVERNLVMAPDGSAREAHEVAPTTTRAADYRAWLETQPGPTIPMSLIAQGAVRLGWAEDTDSVYSDLGDNPKIREHGIICSAATRVKPTSAVMLWDWLEERESLPLEQKIAELYELADLDETTDGVGPAAQ